MTDHIVVGHIPVTRAVLEDAAAWAAVHDAWKAAMRDLLEHATDPPEPDPLPAWRRVPRFGRSRR